MLELFHTLNKLLFINMSNMVLGNRLSDSKNTFCAFIDIQKAYDGVDQMLKCHFISYLNRMLLIISIDLYNNPIACVNVINYVIDWQRGKAGRLFFSTLI